MRLNYPPNVKIILVPCTGKVDVVHMLKAIQKGNLKSPPWSR